MNRVFPFLLLPALVGCPVAYEDVPTKFVGVGYDPSEIGPAPTPYGGVVEYDWVNFAGAGLSLAMMGLASYDEVGPGMAGFRPPYASVFGFSYVFDRQLSAADGFGSVTSVPPDAPDTCYTTFEATGPIGSFKTVDVGGRLSLVTGDGSAGLVLDRTPTDYPPNPQDVFVYYIGLDAYTATPVEGYVPNGGNRPGNMDRRAVRIPNFPFGEDVELRFPGGMPPARAPVAGLPLPSTAAGVTAYALPDAPGPVTVSWEGPTWNAWGAEIAGSGPTTRCLAWPRDDARVVEVPADCADAASLPAGGTVEGQVYTGPWDAEDGAVTFRWEPGERADEIVSLAVRFLGPVDETDPAFLERVVEVEPDEAAVSAWKAARRAGSIAEGVDPPLGRRAPTACEDPSDSAWTFDDALHTASGALVPAMRGDPYHNVSELTCRLADDGEFVLTEAMLENALGYARRAGAQGAIFYFARSTEVDAAVPPAMDAYGQRLDISPVKVTSRAVEIGRFWFEEGS